MQLFVEVILRLVERCEFIAVLGQLRVDVLRGFHFRSVVYFLRHDGAGAPP